MRKCELAKPAYGTSQFLSIGRTYAGPGGRTAQPLGRSLAAARCGQPDVDQGGHDASRPRSGRRAPPPGAARRRARVPRRRCACRRPRRATGSATPPGRAPGRRPPRTSGRPPRPARRRAGRARPRAARAAAIGRARRPPASSCIASVGSTVDRTSGRPRPAVSSVDPVGSPDRDAEDRRVLDRGDLLDPEPDGRLRRASPPGTRSGASAAVPIDSRGRTTSPSAEPRPVDRQRRPRPSRTSNGTTWTSSSSDRPAAPPAGLEPPATVDQRALVLVGEVLGAVESGRRSGGSAAVPAGREPPRPPRSSRAASLARSRPTR